MQSPPRRRNRPSGRRRECAVNSPRPRAAANCAGAALPTPSIKISGGWRRPLAAGTQKETPAIGRCFFLEVTPGFEPGNQGFADPCLTTWLCHRLYFYYMHIWENVHTFFENPMPTRTCGHWSGAGNEARTRYLHLGKVALYQMSYARRWCPEPESNQRHGDFQSPALPTELSGRIFFRASGAEGESQPQGGPTRWKSISWEMATRNGLEPSTSSVTG